MSKPENKLRINIEKVCENAKRLLSKININSNTSIVFDIDDTLINPRTRQLITPVYNLYLYAINLGIVPFIITARIASNDNSNYTVQELANFNIKYKMLFLRSNKCTDVQQFKYKSRERITQDGYLIVMTVGDMLWDISGGYNGIGIKIPS
jgi:predicted secreted acid phosphatase